MTASASISQEYYKILDLWRSISDVKDWRLAIWCAGFNDIDLIDRFLEIERSPVGQTDDIFFRFDAEYHGDTETFIPSLWDEYLSWFTEKPEPGYDIMAALKKDQMLLSDYSPDETIERNALNLWKEMLRLKAAVKGLDENYFCIYFPPTRAEDVDMTALFDCFLQEGIPEGIRIVTIDYTKSRKVKLRTSEKVVLLTPELEMKEALQNELSRDGENCNLLAPENRFKEQVTIVMECTLKKDKKLLGKEIDTLLSISEELKDLSVTLSALFISAEAFYAIEEYKTSMRYSDQTIEQSGQAMEEGLSSGFDYWKLGIFMKAAILSTNKKREAAIELYEKVAQVALQKKDPFYVMEGYRLSGFLYYELGKMEEAFEHFLLSLTGGSYLSVEIRRASTFLYSANLALITGENVRSPRDMEMLEEQMEEWLGEDWKNLVLGENFKQAKLRRRASLF